MDHLAITSDALRPGYPPLGGWERRGRTCLAVVLTGGGGRGMGGSPTLRRLGQAAMIPHALALARAYAPAVAVCTAPQDKVGAGGGVPLLTAHTTVGGSLAEVVAALTFARGLGEARVLTLPFDAPSLPPDLRARLDAALDEDGSADLAVAASGGRLHPACAIWRTSALGALPSRLPDLRTAVVAWERGEADPFLTIGTPDEFAAVQQCGREFGF